MSLTVLTSGTCSLIVDQGRPSTRSYGIPVGGPADRRSLAIGNALLGNLPNVAALEMALTGPTLRAEADLGCSIVGAPFRLQIDGEAIEPPRSFTLRKGQTLQVGGTPHLCRAYLCVVGGLRTREILASRTSMAPLRGGEILACDASEIPGRSLPSDAITSSEPVVLRCLPGLHREWFDTRFFETVYRVTPQADRMGVRLDGIPLPLSGREMVSEPVAPGAVQIVNDGRPIILGVDGQTIGGYPKIAHVIRADLDRLGQLRPGNTVLFESVDESTVLRVNRNYDQEIERSIRRIRTAVG